MDHVKGKIKVQGIIGSVNLELTSGQICRLKQGGKNRKILHDTLEGLRCKGAVPTVIRVKTDVSPKTGEQWHSPEIQAWYNRLPGLPHFLAYKNAEGQKAFWLDNEACTAELPGLFWDRQQAWDAKQRMAVEMPVGEWMVIPAEHRLEATKMLQQGLYQFSPGETGRYINSPGERLHPASVINEKYRDLQDALGLLPINQLTDPYMGEGEPKLKELA